MKCISFFEIGSHSQVIREENNNKLYWLHTVTSTLTRIVREFMLMHSTNVTNMIVRVMMMFCWRIYIEYIIFNKVDNGISGSWIKYILRKQNSKLSNSSLILRHILNSEKKNSNWITILGNYLRLLNAEHFRF